MTMRALMKQAYTEVERPRPFMLACVIGIVLSIVLSIVLPTDLQSYRAYPPDKSYLVVGTDSYLRFANTAAQVAMPIVARDAVGAVQLVYVAIGTTVVTQGLKRLLNDQTLRGVRLGERPSGVRSRHNMPSGHSSMASCAVYYVSRRYGWRHLVYLVPIMLLTMYARVALGAHTTAAVIAGMLVGFLMAAIFTGKLRTK